MKRVSFAMFCGLLIILATGVVIFPQANAQTEVATEKLVVTLRLLNTSEYSYRGENGRFANWEELLAFLQLTSRIRNRTNLKSPQAEMESTTRSR